MPTIIPYSPYVSTLKYPGTEYPDDYTVDTLINIAKEASSKGLLIRTSKNNDLKDAVKGANLLIKRFSDIEQYREKMVNIPPVSEVGIALADLGNEVAAMSYITKNNILLIILNNNEAMEKDFLDNREALERLICHEYIESKNVMDHSDLMEMEVMENGMDARTQLNMILLKHMSQDQLNEINDYHKNDPEKHFYNAVIKENLRRLSAGIMSENQGIVNSTEKFPPITPDEFKMVVEEHSDGVAVEESIVSDSRSDSKPDFIIKDIVEYLETPAEELIRLIYSKTKWDAKKILVNEVVNRAFRLEKGIRLKLTNENSRSIEFIFEETDKDRLWGKTVSGDRGYYVLANLFAMETLDREMNMQTFQLAEKFKTMVKGLFNRAQGSLEGLVEEKLGKPALTIFVESIIRVTHGLQIGDIVDVVVSGNKMSGQMTYLGLWEVKEDSVRKNKIKLKNENLKPKLFDPDEIDVFDIKERETHVVGVVAGGGYVHPFEVQGVIEKLLRGEPVRLFRRMEEDEKLSVIIREGFIGTRGDGSIGSISVVFDLMPPALDSLGIEEHICVMVEGRHMMDALDKPEIDIPPDSDIISQGYDGVLYNRETRLGLKEQVKLFDGLMFKGEIVMLTELY